MKIKEAFAIYTGGGIWLFYGKLDNGNYFLTNDIGWTQILNADPSCSEESAYYEWQQEHLVEELTGDKRKDFCNNLANYLRANPCNCNGMTKHEIEVYRCWFLKEYDYD